MQIDEVAVVDGKTTTIRVKMNGKPQVNTGKPVYCPSCGEFHGVATSVGLARSAERRLLKHKGNFRCPCGRKLYW